MAFGMTRRQFLQGAGAGTLALCLSQLRIPFSAGATSLGEGAALPPHPRYEGFQDIYRKAWTWDSVAKGTHHVNCWYQRACSWNIFVKEGLVLREEQAADYPQTNADVPDFNPRGCQKGACFSHRMYDPTRVLYPLKRMGPRGGGKWTRVTWDEALTDIADRMIAVMTAEGSGGIYWDLGEGLTNGCAALGVLRAGNVLDTPILDMNAEIGDHHPGAAATCGKIVFASSGDDCFYSDLILIWGGNPVSTQIPNAHFFNEARYNGARVVTITPDYNPSAVHADLWVPVNVGTDAALGLSIAHVILEENLQNDAFIKEQTDLSLLVRRDNGLFLRESDMKRGGKDDVFYFHDLVEKKIAEAPKRSLKLEGRDPALAGEYEAETVSGKVLVTPVLTLLREKVAGYAPEAAAKITGTPAAVIRRLAHDIAKARAATIITQSNFSKFYHGLEMERVQILVLALCGQYGKKGSGYNAFPWMSIDAPEIASLAPASLPLALGSLAVMAGFAPGVAKMKLQGYSDEMVTYENTRKIFEEGPFVNSVLFYYFFGGLRGVSGRSREWDPYLKRDVSEYVDEAVAKGWQFAPKQEPKIFFEAGGNILRRVRSYPEIIKTMLPKLDLFVTVDWRMSATAMYSDYVLPSAAWYEKDDVTWATPIMPYAHVTTKAIDPLGESKNEWVFYCLLTKKIQQRAVEKGIKTFRDRGGKERRLDKVYEQFTYGGRYTEGDVEKTLDELVKLSKNLEGTSWKELKEKGYARFTAVGQSAVNIGTATDVKPDETITANTWHTEKKIPWPTLTRRMQFYIDQDLYMELGEQLPTHKDNPAIGGDHPLQMTGGHTRWSIHSSWRDDPLMLRLQRGGPVVCMSVEDARTRGISDGDRVRVRNDLGDFEVEAKIFPAVRPGQVVVYHAWEPQQFSNRRSDQAIIPSPINPIQLAGGYFHLQPMIIAMQPGQNDRGTRVEVEKI
ncbi:MAG: molybdopterin-dependent oxidoreductase [Deltaproteobacteria bacterium]|nr:molybdopterin-dependent oxidoreductase [Deltaproteobacteria bacterium]